jgi:hypothetical protein
VCWIAGKANALFDPRVGLDDDRPATPTIRVKDLAAYFGVASISPRAALLLRAIGIDASTNYVQLDLGTPRYLTGPRRAQILADRARYRAWAD